MGNFNDGDVLHRSCVESCEKSGCVDDSCFNSCKFPVGIDPEGDPSLTKSLDSAYELFLKEPLYLRWKKWDCTSECRYQCMVREEAKRESDGHLPLKYHGKWPFVRFFSLQVCPFLFCSMSIRVCRWLPSKGVLRLGYLVHFSVQLVPKFEKL